MRVAIVTSSYWPIVGGQMIYARDLARELVRQGHQVTVATRFTSRLRRNTWESLSDVDPAASYEEDGVDVRVLRPRGLRRLALYPVHRLHYYERTEGAAIRLFQMALMDALDEAIGTCDVIHFNGVGRELLGFVAEALARERRVPFVMTTHMHPGTWGDSRLDFRLYARADRILAHTEWEKSVYVSRGVDPARVQAIGIGVQTLGTGDAQRARTRYGLDGPTVLFVARKAHYKGYGLLLESAPIVWEYFPEARFVFVGPDQDEPTPRQRAVIGDRRVVETGVVGEQEKADLYAACDALCVPSRAESFGLSYFEAWLYGKPVVGLDIPALREVIGGSGGGVLADDPAPNAIAAAIMRLLGDEELRRAMGTRGKRLAETYRPCVAAQRVAALYAEAQSASGMPGHAEC